MSKGYILTISQRNQSTPPETIISKLSKLPGFEYSTFQYEYSHSQYQHIQLYAALQYKVDYSVFHSVFPNCHVESVRDDIAARQYCRKEDTRLEGPYEIGIFPFQDKKSNRVCRPWTSTIHNTLQQVLESSDIPY